jgi:hypothetical protein
MLTPEAKAAWNAYREAEEDRIRTVSLAALERFILLLLQQPQDEWKAWARDFAGQVSDGGAEIPARTPLFGRVLLPALTDGVIRGMRGSARSLAHLLSAGHIVNAKDALLPEHLRSEAGLLREAVRLDPADSAARTRLVEKMASDLEYSLHELPAGVLYGSDPATAEECDELLKELEQFRAHVEALRREPEFEDLLAQSELHFNAYREYRLSPPPGESYERFLEARHTDGHRK